MERLISGLDRRRFIKGGALAAVGAVGSHTSARKLAAKPQCGTPGEADISNFVVNLDMWWRNYETLHERWLAAAQAGWSKVELWTLGEGDRSAKSLQAFSRETGCRLVHFVADIPNMISSENGKVLAAFRQQAELAASLGVSQMTVTAHRRVEGLGVEESMVRYYDNLASVADVLEEYEVTALLEPLNPYNHSGHLFNGSRDVVALCRAIGSKRIKVNWDFFHMQRSEGNLITAFVEGLDQCGYVQIADSPDRGQPGTGEIDYAVLLSRIRREGYSGPMAFECRPVNDDAERAMRDVTLLAIKLGLDCPG